MRYVGNEVLCSVEFRRSVNLQLKLKVFSESFYGIQDGVATVIWSIMEPLQEEIMKFI